MIKFIFVLVRNDYEWLAMVQDEDIRNDDRMVRNTDGPEYRWSGMTMIRVASFTQVCGWIFFLILMKTKDVNPAKVQFV